MGAQAGDQAAAFSTRFHLEEKQSPSTAQAARQRHGLDVTASHELGLNGSTDEEQLLYAARDGRCIVTKNGDDFLALTDSFAAEGLPHAGVLIVPHWIPGHAYARIARVLAWYHQRYPEGVPTYFASYLSDPSDE